MDETKNFVDQPIEEDMKDGVEPKSPKRFAHGRKLPSPTSSPTNMLTENTKMGYMFFPMENKVQPILDPGLMRGKGATLPFIDELPERLRMSDWKNIPIPIKEAFEEIFEAFRGLKQVHFENFNDIIATQRAVNANHQ